MTKLPFTSSGVETLQERLYVLPDTALQQEANQIRTDFTNWVQQTFALTSEQEAYLLQVNGDYLDTIALYVSHFIGHRLPIVMNPAELPLSTSSGNDDDDDDDSSKLFLFSVEENGTSSPETENGNTYHGQLTITFQYPDQA